MFHKGDIKLAKELIAEFIEKRINLEEQYAMNKDGVPAMEVTRFSANEMAGCFLDTYGFYAYSVFLQFPDSMKASYEANQPGTLKLLERACKKLVFKIPELGTNNPTVNQYAIWLSKVNDYIGSHNKVDDGKAN